MNKKQQPFFNPELSGFCSQMAMILHSGISPLEGITIMLEDSTSDREKDILQQILDTPTSMSGLPKTPKQSKRGRHCLMTLQTIWTMYSRFTTM